MGGEGGDVFPLGWRGGMARGLLEGGLGSYVCKGEEICRYVWGGEYISIWICTWVTSMYVCGGKKGFGVERVWLDGDLGGVSSREAST